MFKRFIFNSNIVIKLPESLYCKTKSCKQWIELRVKVNTIVITNDATPFTAGKTYEIVDQDSEETENLLHALMLPLNSSSMDTITYECGGCLQIVNLTKYQSPDIRYRCEETVLKMLELEEYINGRFENIVLKLPEFLQCRNKDPCTNKIDLMVKVSISYGV